MNATPSVLIVDDDAGIRRTLEMILTRKNYQTFTAPDGKTALAVAQQHALNLALVDVRLPDISGDDLLLELKTIQPDLETLVLTGNATLESAIRALANGAYRYLIKPVNPDELLATLEQALHKQRLVIENRELLASLQSIFRAAPVGIGVVSDRVLLQLNERICEMTGYTRAELVGQDARLLYPTTEEYEYVGTEKYRQIREHGIGTVETRWRRKDGTVLDILLSSVPLDPADWSKGITFTALDITDRKRAEAALRESEERFRTLFENATIGIYRTTPDGRILLANPTIVRLLGYNSFEELAQRNLEAEGFEPNYPRAEFRARIEREGEIRALEAAWKRRDGSIVFVRESAKAIRDASGKILYYEGTVEDVTERARAQAALQAERDFAQQVLNALGQGVTVTNADGHFEYVNPAYARLIGKTPDELIGKRPYDVTAPEDHAVLQQQRAQRERGETSTYETRLVHADGRTIPVQVTAVPRWADGRVVGAIAVTTDLTERYQREREMQAVAELSAALRTATTRAEMLPIILDNAMQTLNAQAAALITRHAITDESVIECARGAWAKGIGRRTPPGEGLSARIFATQQPYVTDDIANDPNFFWKDWSEVRAVASVPLLAHDEPIGTLSIGRATPIAPSEVRVLVALAGIAASALRRAELHEQTERRLQHLIALRLVDQTINASLDLSFTLDVLLDQVLAQLRADAALVWLLDVTTHTLRYAAGRGLRHPLPETSTIRLSESYAGEVARNRAMIRLSHLPRDRRATLWANEDFTAYCGVPLIAKGQVTGVLEVFHRAPFDADADWLDLLEMLAGQAAIAIDNARLFQDLQRSTTQLVLSYDATIEGWSRALELRDQETEGHTQRVAQLTEQLARAIGIGETELVHLRRGALLHDIGKMAVPDAILHKNGALTEEEWVIMRRHPEFAYELLKPIAYLQPALDIPYCHHEKWDGSGYPRGLKGEAIPLAARIFALADVWDALRSDRPYRPAWSDAQVREYLRAQSGKHFDPLLIERFLKLV